MVNSKSEILKLTIESPLGDAATATVPVSIPDLADVRAFAASLNAVGQDWSGEAFGWNAEYIAERAEPPLDSKLTFTPADFWIGESGIWFFSLSWEHGRTAPPLEFLDARALRVASRAAV